MAKTWLLVKFMFLQAMISHPQTHILYYRMSQKISTHTFTYTVEPNICRKMSADKEKIFPDLFSWF